jgi:hypothetical protein
MPIFEHFYPYSTSLLRTIPANAEHSQFSALGLRWNKITSLSSELTRKQVNAWSYQSLNNSPELSQTFPSFLLSSAR